MESGGHGWLILSAIVAASSACRGTVDYETQSSPGTQQGGAGGAEGGLDVEGGPGESGGKPSLQGLPPTGSYDFVFEEFDPTKNIPTSDLLSYDLPFRLDLAQSGGSYAAVLTPRWGDQVSLQVEASPAELLLQGQVTITGKTPSGKGGDTWKTFVLERFGDGSLSGAITGAGRGYLMITDDVGSIFELRAKGQLAPDVRNPELKLEAAPVGSPPAGRLPWEPIVVRYAEGVLASGMDGSFALQGEGGPVDVAWEPRSSQESATWAGSLESDGYLRSWSLDSTSATLSVAEGLRDPATHSTAFYQAPLWFIGVPAAVDSYAFDSAAAPSPLWWGYDDIRLYGLDTGSDPHCEAGGCLLISPFFTRPCPDEPSGFAGRLKGTPAALKVRYQLLKQGTATSAPSVSDKSPFWIVVAVPGTRPAWQEAPAAPQYLTYVGTDPDTGIEDWWATDWLSLVVEVPTSPWHGNEVGFAVHAGQRKDDCFWEWPTSELLMLVVDSVMPQ